MISPLTTKTDPSHLFLFNDTATTEIYTLSLHDALPILAGGAVQVARPTPAPGAPCRGAATPDGRPDRRSESTRLNSSHMSISYAVFCLKKKKKRKTLNWNTKKKEKMKQYNTT